MTVTNIPIPAVLEIKRDIIYELENILLKHHFSSALILFDQFCFDHYKNKIEHSFQSISLNTLLLNDELSIDDLIKLTFSLNTYDVILSMGGGTIIDYGKYMAFSRRTPFMSVPTSASNDGFASGNCSLKVGGKKTTVPAKVPYGIIADLGIIQTAPERFILAGIGDLMSNITALYDWEFEEIHGVSTVNAFSAMLSKKAVNSFIRTPMTDIKNPILLKELVSSLTMGGVSTVISGNSAPISGSEHLISHALDKISVAPQMHGIQVGIATYIIANVQEHRAERMNKVFSRTGFFEYVKTLKLNQKEYKTAIEMAPSIKPNRYTYLHEEKYQKKAIDFLQTDPILEEIFNW
ncbi:iron-containing alcohol dehydrogenase family protein [Bacillus carboniphilus]|uniref:Iron-containing alcohol dehydrogenase family protein n=1 Tax=Bacillus carboniphilus TaxID=86663 RepID=A0ABY9JX80_9BACI|nr:iron-containing alcohol dehydrogenase family protein [Bacillus carboniphilus]WLR43388.1 iron-containing alcohol dehydrogenase family protein [Bacillus carboniphilus]